MAYCCTTHTFCATLSDGEGVEDNVDGLLALSIMVEVSIDEGAVEVLMVLLGIGGPG